MRRRIVLLLVLAAVCGLSWGLVMLPSTAVSPVLAWQATDRAGINTIQPTVTRLPISVEILNIALDTDRSEFILTLGLVNADRAAGYYIRIFDKNTNRQINEVYYRTAPTEQVRISTLGIADGTYLIEVELRIPGRDEQPTASIPIAYNAPRGSSSAIATTDVPPSMSSLADNPLTPILVGTIIFSLMSFSIVVAVLLITARRSLVQKSFGNHLNPSSAPAASVTSPARPTAGSATVFDGESTKAQRIEPPLPILAKLRLVETPSPFLGLPAEVLIAHQPFIIGRASKSSTPDLDLKAEGVSRTHAIVSMTDGRFYIADQESRNGTYINGERIAKGELHELKSADRVRFDKQIEFEFLIRQPTSRDFDQTNMMKAPEFRAQVETYREMSATPNPNMRTTPPPSQLSPDRPRLPASITATLEILDAPNEDVGKVFALQFMETRIGSEKDANNDVALSGRGISREHARLICEIMEERPAFFVVDDNSTNGTRLTRRGGGDQVLVPRRRELLQAGVEYVILIGERTKLSFLYSAAEVEGGSERSTNGEESS